MRSAIELDRELQPPLYAKRDVTLVRGDAIDILSVSNDKRRQEDQQVGLPLRD
jgi:hypothetical protein